MAVRDAPKRDIFKLRLRVQLSRQVGLKCTMMAGLLIET